MKTLIPYVFLSVAFLMSSCKRPVEAPVQDIPPSTHIFVEGRVDTVPAYQIIHWYGNDEDGYVVGYYYRWDRDTFVYTTKNCDTFTLSVPDTDSIGVHTFEVKAVDNEGMEDPTPAELILPVKNSPPTIAFQHGTIPPDTSFPVVSFYPEAHDIDGDESLIGYYTFTDYDTAVKFISIDSTRITFEGIPQGTHIFTFMSVDKSHAVSDPIADTLYVQNVTGHILVVDASMDNQADNLYKNFFDTYGHPYSYWNIEKFLPYSSYDIDKILNSMGFSLIFWYSVGDTTRAVQKMQRSLETYLDNGNKLVITSQLMLKYVQDTTNPNTVTDFMRNYLGVDSIVSWTHLLTRGALITPCIQGYDTLAVSSTLISNFQTISPNDSLQAASLYQIPSSNMEDCAIYYPATAPRVFFFTINMHELDGNNNVSSLLGKIMQALGE